MKYSECCRKCEINNDCFLQDIDDVENCDEFKEIGSKEFILIKNNNNQNG